MLIYAMEGFIMSVQLMYWVILVTMTQYLSLYVKW